MVEKALSVDNIFIFLVVFSYLAIPAKYQHRVLFYGKLGALFFRAIFIALGSVLMQCKAIVLFFGVFLIFTGIKIFFTPDKPLDPERNPVIRFMKKLGVLHATRLFVALVFVEITDIIFAIDSVPAI